MNNISEELNRLQSDFLESLESFEDLYIERLQNIKKEANELGFYLTKLPRSRNRIKPHLFLP